MAGKILHIDRNGRGVANHPFCPANANLDHVCTKLFAKGFRNPYRFKLRPGGGLVLGDVGWDRARRWTSSAPAGRATAGPATRARSARRATARSRECAAEYAKEGTARSPRPRPRLPAQRSVGGGDGRTHLPGHEYPSGYRDTIFFGDYAAGFIKKLRVGVDRLGDRGGELRDGLDRDGSGGGAERRPGLHRLRRRLAGHRRGEARRVLAGQRARRTANAAATPTSGAAPLAVQFSSAGSSDPDGDPLTYAWDFGDGTSEHGGQPEPHLHRRTARLTATLTVSDGRGLTATTPSTSPWAARGRPRRSPRRLDESIYRDGDTMTLRGSATRSGGRDPPGARR